VVGRIVPRIDIPHAIRDIVWQQLELVAVQQPADDLLEGISVKGPDPLYETLANQQRLVGRVINGYGTESKYLGKRSEWVIDRQVSSRGRYEGVCLLCKD